MSFINIIHPDNPDGYRDGMTIVFGICPGELVIQNVTKWSEASLSVRQESPIENTATTSSRSFPARRQVSPGGGEDEVEQDHSEKYPLSVSHIRSIR